MDEDLERALEMFGNLFAGMPPAVFVATSLVLLALAAWQTRRALRGYRIVKAIARAPLVDLRSRAGGLVKLRGTAQPPPPLPGKSPATVVWYSRSRRSGSSRSTRTTTDNFLIEDDHGRCAVLTAQAEIVPTRSVASEGFLDKSSSSSEKIVHAGDPVFAIGELRRGQPLPAGLSAASCQLARRGGVLLVSGSPERDVTVLYSLWSVVHVVLSLLCWGALAYGAWVHVGSYPPGKGGPVGTFFDSLQATPLQPEPGREHPLWNPVDAGERSAEPQPD